MNLTRFRLVLSLAVLPSIAMSEINRTTTKANIDASINTQNFHPNTTTPASTLGHLNVGWQPTPKHQLAPYGWFMNSISIGLGDKFEVGIIPFNYIIINSLGVTDDKISVDQYYQFVGKFNILSSSLLKLTAYYALDYISISAKDWSGYEYNRATQDYSLLTEYWFNGIQAVSLNLDSSQIISSEEKSGYEYQRNKLLDSRIDYMHSLSANTKLTAGFSRRYTYRLASEDEAIAESIPILYGVGSSFTWIRPRNMFSSPSLGFHYYPQKKHTQLIFGTNFY